MRLRVWLAGAGAVSALFYACIKNPAVPPLSVKPPSLIVPANGATTLPFADTLRWNTIGGATSYCMQVSTSSAFATTISNQDSLKDTAALIIGLLNNTTYYWEVRAIDTVRASAWTGAWSFSTLNIIYSSSFG